MMRTFLAFVLAILRAGGLVSVVLLLSGLGVGAKSGDREGRHSIQFLGTRP
jgi:hypothetical protein